LPNLLKNLMLEELSLVDKPANPLAMAPLYKRDTSNGEDMNEELKKALEAIMADKEVDMDAAATELLKSLEGAETLKAENERLRKGLLDEGYVIKADVIEKKAPVETIEVNGEAVAKSEIPAPVLKALEDAEQAKIEKAEEDLRKRAVDKLPHFEEKVAVSLMKMAEASDETDVLMQALEAADKAFEDKMKELGKSDTTDLEEPSAKMDALVKGYMETNQLTNKDFAKAYAAVSKTAEGKQVLKAIYKESK
jgi:hypothetical protein